MDPDTDGGGARRGALVLGALGLVVAVVVVLVLVTSGGDEDPVPVVAEQPRAGQVIAENGQHLLPPSHLASFHRQRVTGKDVEVHSVVDGAVWVGKTDEDRILVAGEVEGVRKGERIDFTGTVLDLEDDAAARYGLDESGAFRLRRTGVLIAADTISGS